MFLVSDFRSFQLKFNSPFIDEGRGFVQLHYCQVDVLLSPLAKEDAPLRKEDAPLVEKRCSTKEK